MIEFIIFIILPLILLLFFLVIKNLKVQYFFSLIISLLHLALSICIFMGFFSKGFFVFFEIDPLNKLFILILSNIYFWVVLVSYSFLKRAHTNKKDNGKKYYFIFLNLYLAANSAAILSNHFGMFWVATEATTLSIAPLIYFYRNEEALEAMWKYVFLVSIGIAFAFIGILFLTLSASGTAFERSGLFYKEFVENAVLLNPIWLKAAFIFIFVGLSTKIGIVPMHSADIDATSNAPSPISALMSGSLRITPLLGVMRILQIIRPTSSYEFARVVLITGGLFSVFTAFVFMFRVKNYKRMLAYSSVEHMGIITMGVGIGGLAFIGAMFHAVYNSITKVILFLTAGNIYIRYKSKEVAKVHFVLNVLPKTGWLFLAAFFAITGIPPFGIFFSEIKIFEGILFSDKPWIIVPFLFFLFFIFVNMGKTIFAMLYKKGDNPELEKNTEQFHFIHLTIIVLLIFLLLLAVFSPDILNQNIINISKEFGMSL